MSKRSKILVGLAALIVIGLILNLYFAHNIYLGFILGVLYFLSIGYFIGQAAMPEEGLGWQIFFGVTGAIFYIIIIGSIIYYLYQLNDLACTLIATSLPLLAISLIFIRENYQKNSFRLNLKILNLKTIILTIGFLIIETSCFYILLKSGSSEAIRSPWWAVPGEFFIFYFLATSILVTIAYYGKIKSLSLILTMIHIFLSISVAQLVYKLGYGFDPFIHQATENIIASQGFILPKPFYYIGQYSLVVILSKIFQIPVVIIDKQLVPFAYSVLAPLTAYFSFKKINPGKRFLLLLPIIILTIPFSSYIVTTPQALANIFTLFTILVSLGYFFEKEKNYLLILMLFSVLATILVHPLSGIPALIFFSLILVFKNLNNTGGKTKHTLNLIAFETIVVSLVAIPLMFIINSKIGENLTSAISITSLFDISKISAAFGFLGVYLKNNFNLAFDLIYWYGNNFFLIYLFISLTGLMVFAFRRETKKVKIFIYAFLIIFVNYLLLRLAVNFPSLIDYERINYAQRILEISLLFLLPLYLGAYNHLISKLPDTTALARLAFIIFISLFITSTLYFSYPRADDYNLDRGYNITQTDINAVRFIDESDKGDYIVLANQMTSVAAIKEFGFKKYYTDKKNSDKQYFYYPIPTGDPLYQFYLDMVYKKPTKDIAKSAADLVGINTVYLILDKYWWKFDQLVEEAKQEANNWQDIDQGQAYIFKYIIN